MIKFSIKQMFNFNVHLGYMHNRWNPKCAPYLYGIRNNLHIINLENSFYMLKRSIFFISEIIKSRGNLLLINLRLGSYKYNALRSKKFGQFSIMNKYTGGLLTNFKNVKCKHKSLHRMRRLPSVVFVSNLNNCLNIIQECQRLNIPLMGIVDSNINPEYFTYPIPGNSESLISNKFYYSLIFKAVYFGILKQRVKYLKAKRNMF